MTYSQENSNWVLSAGLSTVTRPVIESGFCSFGLCLEDLTLIGKVLGLFIIWFLQCKGVDSYKLIVVVTYRQGAEIKKEDERRKKGGRGLATNKLML
jgi:hypothetical protein